MLGGVQASLHPELMHETGLINRPVAFFIQACKSLNPGLLRNVTGGDDFFNGAFSAPCWANSHSGLGEMTQVTEGENSLL